MDAPVAVIAFFLAFVVVLPVLLVGAFRSWVSIAMLMVALVWETPGSPNAAS